MSRSSAARRLARRWCVVVVVLVGGGTFSFRRLARGVVVALGGLGGEELGGLAGRCFGCGWWALFADDGSFMNEVGGVSRGLLPMKRMGGSMYA